MFNDPVFVESLALVPLGYFDLKSSIEFLSISQTDDLNLLLSGYEMKDKFEYVYYTHGNLQKFR